MEVTTDIRKILRNGKGSLILIFDVLSESCIGFFSFSVFLAAEDVISFTVTRSYRNRGSVIMRTYVKTFHVNIGYNLA